MNKQIRKIQTAAKRVLGMTTGNNYSLNTALRRMKEAIRDWADSGEDVTTGLFSDHLSGEIELAHVGEPKNASKADKNELYQLNDSCGGYVVMTGAEFESIVKQWRSYRKGWK